jgi:hypothetical protein
VRTLLVCFLLLAACGGDKPKPQGRPEEVATAVFLALQAGETGPLEPHLMTAEEAKKVTGVDLDDGVERDRWRDLFAQHHERLNVDWATAVAGRPKVKYDPMGQGAVVNLPIKSERGTVSVDVAVTKVGRRFVFAGVKPAAGSEPKQAAPDEEEKEGGG